MKAEAILEDAHKQAAPAMGRLSCILAARRGLTRTAVVEMAEALEQAAVTLRSILTPEQKES